MSAIPDFCNHKSVLVNLKLGNISLRGKRHQTRIFFKIQKLCTIHKFPSFCFLKILLKVIVINFCLPLISKKRFPKSVHINISKNGHKISRFVQTIKSSVSLTHHLIIKAFTLQLKEKKKSHLWGFFAWFAFFLSEDAHFVWTHVPHEKL